MSKRRGLVVLFNNFLPLFRVEASILTERKWFFFLSVNIKFNSHALVFDRKKTTVSPNEKQPVLASESLSS